MRAADDSLDLVISDWKLPGCEGLEIVREVHATRPRLPIILITANGDLRISEEELRGGAVALLRKPFTQDSLLRALRSALAGPGGHDGT